MTGRPRENAIGFALIAPFVLFFTVFLLGPFLYSFWLSLHEVSIYSDWYDRLGTMDFVGLRNYAELLFDDPEFWWSMLMTLYYAVLTIPTSIVFALVLAILLNSRIRAAGLFRTGFFLPQVVDLLVVGIIWMLLFKTPEGALDRIIRNALGGLGDSGRLSLCMAAGLLLAGAFALVAGTWSRERLLADEQASSRPMAALLSLAFLVPLLLGASWLTARLAPEAGAAPGGASAQAKALSVAVTLLASLTLGTLAALLLRQIVALERRTGNDLVRHAHWATLTLMLCVPLVVAAAGFNRAVVTPFFARQPVGLLDNPVTLLPVIALVMVLKNVGLGMILFLTTIQQIPKSVYEAAEVDGATARQQAFLITLPLVRPIILFLSITGLMATLNAFTEVYAMTFDSGGPPTDFLGETVRSGKLTGYYLWTSFRDFFYGRAAALSFILMAVALLVSAANVAVLREREPA